MQQARCEAIHRVPLKLKFFELHKVNNEIFSARGIMTPWDPLAEQFLTHLHFKAFNVISLK